MQNVVSFFILLLVSQTVFSQTAEKTQELLNKAEKDETLRQRLEPRVSDKYYLGRFLVYDCDDRHFACVNLPSYYNCKESRDRDLQKKEVFLSCTPLKQYDSLEECTNAYLGFIYRRTNKSFCVNRSY